jgi:hypothetical protein
VVNATQTKFKKTERLMRERFEHRFTAVAGQADRLQPVASTVIASAEAGLHEGQLHKALTLSRMEPSE